jgi:hypothetical protein
MTGATGATGGTGGTGATGAGDDTFKVHYSGLLEASATADIYTRSMATHEYTGIWIRTVTSSSEDAHAGRSLSYRLWGVYSDSGVPVVVQDIKIIDDGSGLEYVTCITGAGNTIKVRATAPDSGASTYFDVTVHVQSTPGYVGSL